MPDPLVSIIVPAFNAASTVQETLRSALAQTYSRIEVIVVDDGSTDDTAAIVTDVARHDARVHLERRPWFGVAAARNHAIELASGEFIAPLDADDLWHPSKIQRQLNRFQMDEPDMGLVYSWHRSINADSLVLKDGAEHALEGWVLLQHLQWNFVGNGSAPLIRTKALSGLRYESSLQRRHIEGCEDYLLQLQVARHWRFGCAPGFLIGYRRSPKSMSANWVRLVRSHAAMYETLEPELSGPARSLCRHKGVEHLVRLSRKRATYGRLREAARALNRALNRDMAHGLRRIAVEFGGLPALTSGKLRRTDPKPLTSTPFLDLDPMEQASS